MTVLISTGELRRRVAELGGQITADYANRDLLIVCVLKGAVIFFADLVREVKLNCECDFVAISSYGAADRSSGAVRILKDLDVPIADRDVLVVEDIVDSGLTLRYLTRMLERRAPRSLEACVLLSKSGAEGHALSPKYVGFHIKDRFVVGYGLDRGHRYRNLEQIVALES
jgi:hypoxanthine phosphoribosyltransferase